MATSTATAIWHGNLIQGSGTVTAASSAFGPLGVDWRARTERPSNQTSPEELIAAAHAACYCMALSAGLAQAGHEPAELETTADVAFSVGSDGAAIRSVHLKVRGSVPGLTVDQFRAAAEAAKEGCPVSKALKGNVELSVEAALAG